MPQSGAQTLLTAPGATASLYRLGLGEPIAPGHETILNTLNKWKAYADGQTYLAVENFLGTEPLWDQVPLIFAQDHPDCDLVSEDLAKALASVTDYKGRPGSIPGYVSGTAVETSGQPRITLTTTFTDPEVQALYEAGVLSLSHGMYADEDEAGHLVGKVRPNHVLVFVQDQTNQPVDQGAMFLSKNTNGGAGVKQFTGIGKVISEKRRGVLKAALDTIMSLYDEMTGGSSDDTGTPGKSESKTAKEPSIEDRQSLLQKALTERFGTSDRWVFPTATYENTVVFRGESDQLFEVSYVMDADGTVSFGTPVEVEVQYVEKKFSATFPGAKIPDFKNTEKIMDAEAEKQLAASKTEQERLAKELTDANAKIAKMEADAAEAAKAAKLAKQEEDWKVAKTVLDVGLIHKPEDEAAKKAEFIDNPAAFMAKYCAKKPVDPKKEDGTQYGAKGGDGTPAKPTALEVARELRQSTGRR